MRAAFLLFIGAGLALIAAVAVFTGPKRAGDAASPAISQPDVDPIAVDSVRRLQAKAEVTRRLVAGELTAPDAADWFRYLDETSASARIVPVVDEGLSVDDHYGRQAVRWAKESLESDGAPPSQVAALVRRLASELRADGRYGAAAFTTTQSSPNM